MHEGSSARTSRQLYIFESRRACCGFSRVLGLALLLSISPFAQAHSAKDRESIGPGLVTEFSASLDDVLQALHEVLEDQTIHGTHIFDKEPTLTGAVAADSTPLFEPWEDSGAASKVFYKIRKGAIAPRHFRDSADQGTIAVRYVVTPVTPDRTRLRIDAIFVETYHKTLHPSDGTVESSEFKVIQGHLQAIQFAEQEAADAQRRREGTELAARALKLQRENETTRLAAAQSSVEDLEQRVNSLRHEVERRVKAPGTDLKAAPFRGSAKLATLAAYTEVVIVVVTEHWYGVETPNGQRGWLPLDQLEPLP